MLNAKRPFENRVIFRIAYFDEVSIKWLLHHIKLLLIHLDSKVSTHLQEALSYILGFKDIWAQLYNNFLKAVHFVQCSCFLWSSSSNFEASFSNYFIDPYQRDQKCNYFNYKFSSLQFWPNQFEGEKLSKGKKTIIISISNGSGNLIINCILKQSCQLCQFLISTFFPPFQNCKWKVELVTL